MSFDQFESSANDGQPIELYEFRLGGETFRFASTEDDITVGVDVYAGSEVRRSPVIVGPEARSSTLSITFSSSNLLARRYVNIVPGQKATLTIFRLHRPDPAQELRTIFKGVVKSVGFDQLGARASIVVLPLTEALSRSAPRIVFSSTCNHILYDSRCKVNSTLFRFQGTVSLVNGNQITVPGLNANGDGWATGGYCTLSGADFRTINDHTGDVITLLQPFPSGTPTIGQAIEIFAGCDRSLETCVSKFSNEANFGGFRFVPLRDPFGKGIG